MLQTVMLQWVNVNASNKHLALSKTVLRVCREEKKTKFNYCNFLDVVSTNLI